VLTLPLSLNEAMTSAANLTRRRLLYNFLLFLVAECDYLYCLLVDSCKKFCQ